MSDGCREPIIPFYVSGGMMPNNRGFYDIRAHVAKAFEIINRDRRGKAWARREAESGGKQQRQNFSEAGHERLRSGRANKKRDGVGGDAFTASQRP